jgi:hypothetical protein
LAFHSPRHWQHARGLRFALASIRPVLATRSGLHLESAFIYPDVGNTLGDYTSNRYSFDPVLATRSGATPRIGIHLPRRWQHARGLRLIVVFIRPDVGNTLGGCASHWYSFALALATRSGAASSNSMLATSTSSATTTKHSGARQRHRLQQAFDNIITTIRPPCDSTVRDMQELHLVP